MSENCNHNCEGCQADCGSRKADFKQPANKYSHIKKVIGVVSGKGGVGKSLVTCLLAAGCAKAGLKVGVLDADITGPSVPKSFGVHSRAMQDGECLLPAVTDGGIKLMSINLLLESESAISAARNAAAKLADAAPDAEAAVALAAFACADAYARTTADAIQMHGGIAFTWEHPAHLYLRRARSGAQLFGASNLHRERFLTALEA